MRVDDERRGLKLPGGATRAVVVAALATGLYAASNEFYGGHSGPNFQSITAGEQKSRDYFDHFAMGDMEIELTAVTKGSLRADGTYDIAILGRSAKDPSTVFSSGDWKFQLGSSDKIFDAIPSVLPRESDNSGPFDFEIVGSVHEGSGSWRLDVIQKLTNNGSENGGMNEGSAVRSIPLSLQ